jgi:hypothetical protein
MRTPRTGSSPGSLLRSVVLFGRGGSADPRCPNCGSFLDAPRVNRVTGRLARKCSTCREWHPTERELAPTHFE